MGGVWALDHLWRRLGVRACMERLLAERRLHPPSERVLFALVPNRALKPLSKLAAWSGSPTPASTQPPTAAI
jgi:hypothetical protein